MKGEFTLFVEEKTKRKMPDWTIPMVLNWDSADCERVRV